MADLPHYIGSPAWLVVFVVIFLVIVAGNLLTICAIHCDRHLSSITANKFIYSLAISDILVALYIPYHVFYYTHAEEMDRVQIYCIVLFMIPVFACSHSICKLLTIAADRYVAIVHPLHYNRYMTKKMVWVLILGGWILTIVLSTVPIYYNEWDGEKTCDLVNFLPTIYFNYMLTPLFGMAWLTMLVVYLKIWKEARRHAARVERANSLTKSVHANNSKSFQVVMLTLGCFSICWLPYFIVTTYFRVTGTSIKFSLSYEIAFTMAVCNSGMNPVIYAWKNSNFREAFWCLLTCHSPNAATNKTNYITNHVPSSKKSSIANGGGGHDNVVAQTEIRMEEMNSNCDEHECSAATETTTVNALIR